MLPPSFLRLPALAALLLPAAAAAQVAPTLLGRWQTSRVAFSAPTTALPDSVLARLDNPEVADLNQAIFTGEALLRVTFKADSTYDFTIMRDGSTVRYETGTFQVRQGRLYASSPGSPDGPSFDDQLLLRLTRRYLTLAFPADPALPGVEQQVEYRRVGSYPGKSELPK